MAKTLYIIFRSRIQKLLGYVITNEVRIQIYIFELKALFLNHGMIDNVRESSKGHVKEL